MNKIYTEAKRAIEQSEKVVIACHVNPDGDAIGSSLAVYHLLKRLGKEVRVIVPNIFPDFLKWLPDADKVMVGAEDIVESEKMILQADLILLMDFNKANRVEVLTPFVNQSKAYKILIDHHLEPDNFTDLVFSTTSVSSTSELLYSIIEAIYGKEAVSVEMAQCIYTGIMTDTGNFSYSFNARTLTVSSILMEIGVDPIRIHQQIYDTYTSSRLKILGHCLLNKMELIEDGKAAYISFTQDEMIRLNHKEGDTEGVVNYPLSVKGVLVTAMLTEKPDRIKISLRSKGDFSVNELSQKYFNGGGHKNASGGHLFMSMDEAIDFYKKVISENKDLIDKHFLDL